MSPELHIDILQRGKETVKKEVKPGGIPFSRVLYEGRKRVLVIGIFPKDGEPRKHEVVLRDREKKSDILRDPSRLGNPTELKPGRTHVRVFNGGNPELTQVVYFHVTPNENKDSAS